VYEALTRAEAKRNRSDEAFDDAEASDEFADEFACVEVDDEPGVEVSPEIDDDEEGFNFLRYSLRTTSVFDRGRVRREAALVRRSIAQPSREVAIDPNRVDPHLVTFYNFDRQASEHYNKLALTLISRAAERGIKRVLVASPQHGDGRTTVTLNLACALARARQRVLVIDCNLMEPAVDRMLGIDSDIGMVEAFTQQMAPGMAAVRVMPYGFNILPTKNRIENPVEILAAPGFWKMLQAFDSDNDFILFDSPPLLAMGDSSLLVRFTDATLMVLRAGATNSAQMAKAITPFTQEDILGVVINRAND
jgi:Mrp family chromosome partitioning ATPase